MKKSAFAAIMALAFGLAVLAGAPGPASAKTVNDRLVSATKAVREMSSQNDVETMADLVKKENWEAEKGETDRKPVGNDADPVVPTRNVRETLGIIMKLTPTTIPVAGAGV